MNKLSFRSQNQRKKSLKYGGYATITTIVLLAALVLFNVLFDQLDIKVDLTSEELYTPGDQTMEILDALEDDVMIYGLYNTGTEENETNAKVIMLVEAYCKLSKHVDYKRIDPLLDPAFANQFLMDESATLDNGTLIVQNQTTGKFKTLPLTSLYEVTTDYTYLTRTVTGFSAEEALTSAIQYVTMVVTPTLYQLQGHGEKLLSEGFIEYLGYSNYDVDEINLVLDNILDFHGSGAKVIVVNAPTQDLSDSEYETMLNYMESGGRLLFLAEHDTPELPNFARLMDRFGLSLQTGTMVETDPNYYYQYYSIVLPILATNNEITQYLLHDSNNYVLMALPAAVNISDEVSSRIKISSLATTSENAIIKQGDNNAVTYEEGDIQGPFNLIVAAEEEVNATEEGIETAKMVVIGNSEFLDSYATTGNFKLTTIICDYLQDTGSSLYISSKNLEEGTIATSDADFFVWGAIYVVLLPAILVVLGVVIYLRRKHR